MQVPIKDAAMAIATDHEAKHHLTILYEAAGDGWVTARIEEEPAAISQGRNEREAYENVLDALHDVRHVPTRTERVAYAFEARVITPLRERLDRLTASR
jgi:hypothetical protein